MATLWIASDIPSSVQVRKLRIRDVNLCGITQPLRDIKAQVQSWGP